MLGGSLSCGSTNEDNAALGFDIIETSMLVSRRHDGEALRRTWSVMRLGLRLMGIRQVSMTGDVIVRRVQNRKLISESGLRSTIVHPKMKVGWKAFSLWSHLNHVQSRPWLQLYSRCFRSRFMRVLVLLRTTFGPSSRTPNVPKV